ncbi:MAG: hypothetical protein RL140_54 [Actinomycetota bacterium]
MQATAIVVVVALIAAIAIFSEGFDVKNVRTDSQNIWILQKNSSATGGNSGQSGLTAYGRVNTEVNELTAYNSVELPNSLVQGPTGDLLFAEGSKRYINISSANPIDYGADSEENISLEMQVVSIEMGDSVTAMVLDNGQLYVSTLSGSAFGAPKSVSPPKGVDKFASVAVTSDDQILVFSSASKQVFKYDPIRESWGSGEAVTGSSDGEFQLASVGDKWALLEVATGNLWLSGGAEPLLAPGGSQLQKSSPSSVAGNVYLSTPTAFVSVNISNREVDQAAAEVPGGIGTTRPLYFGGNVYSVWLAGDAGWFLSTNDNAVQPLDYGAKKLDVNNLKDITFQSNDTTAVINDTYSGWAWSLPTGKLVVGTQDWASLDEEHKPCKGPECEVDGGKKPKPPVAKNDTFGVRAGDLITLPVLLNDSDPNKGDVLTIVPDSVKGLDPNFGEVRVSSSEQMLTVMVKSNASGSKSFKYRITDGTGQPNSNVATVTLKVVPDSAPNKAPGWCRDVVATCIQQEPFVSVRPGSEVTIPYLNGWVDPDGDRFFISAAEISSGEGNVAFTSAGELVYQNENAGDKSSSQVTIDVTVSDIRGASTKKALSIAVQPDASFVFDAPVIVATPNEPVTVDFAEYASGVQGVLSISDLHKVRDTDPVDFEMVDGAKVKFTANDVKPTQFSLSLRDASGAEVSSIVRVNVVQGEALKLSTSPVTVLLSPGLDTSVNVFTAAHNPAGKSLVVSNLSTSPAKGSLLLVDKIRGGHLRVRGQNENGATGFVGVINYTLSDGDSSSDYKTKGQAFVYVMPTPEDKPVVARRDQVVIRAGASAEIDVLANDIGNPGIPLAIDSKSLQQEEKTSCLPGGLIFAGGGKIRVVAPTKAGGYSCGYSVYASNNPTVKTLATLTIKVVDADGSGQAPIPVDLFARVRAGETVNIPVPTSGVDPDGDSVLVQTIAGVKGDKGAAYINPDGASIEYSALDGVTGQDTFTYTLIDSSGMVSASARVKVAILGGDPDTAPVTVNDYAEVLVGAENKVIIDPVSNDFDPQQNVKKPMVLVANSVIPDAPKDSTNYRLWAAALSVTKGTNLVTVKAGKDAMAMRFIYTVKGASGSTSSGYINVKVTSDALKDAPDITDTYVTSAQLDDLVNGGIDVITNKVIWTSGDSSKLKLSLWGDTSGFSISGGVKISAGSKPEDPRIVIFKLTGTNFYGEEVFSYGLMHLPGTKPRITFDPAASRQTVDEGKSVDFDIAELTNVADPLVIGKVKAHGVRPNAKCSVASGTKITYSAGNGEPWGDFCDIELKIKGSNDDFVTILVPISITPKDPKPVLSDHQLTVIPGSSALQEFDLQDMTDWYGKDTSSLKYKFEGGADLFDLSFKAGTSVLQIKAFGNSRPGEKRNIKISVVGYPDTEPANLVLVVGQLPENKPVAPTLILNCSSTAGESGCEISASQMNGTPGVYNPYDGTPLVFAPFGYSNGDVNYASGANKYACGKVTIKTTADRIFATWSDKPEGSKCLVRYKVLDREGRVGDGNLEFSFEGIPGNVRSVTQVGYTGSSITLQVVPPTGSFPEVTAFEIVDERGDVSNCDIDESGGITRCLISNLDAYDGVNKSNLHSYSVKAVNGQGLSKTARTYKDAYAYRAPKKLSKSNLKAASVYDPQITETAGVAEVTIFPVVDPSVARYEISGGVGNPVKKLTGDNFDSFKIRVQAKPGVRSKITVSAYGRIDPPVKDLVEDNSAVWIGRVVGKPKVESVSAKTQRSGPTWTGNVTAVNVNRNFSDQKVYAVFALFPGGTTPRCDWSNSTHTEVSVTGGSGMIIGSGSYESSEQALENLKSPALTNIQENTGYTPYVCISNSYAYATAFGKSLSTLSDPAAGAFAYDINPNPTITRNGSGVVTRAEWLVKSGREETKAGVTAWFNGTADKSGAWSKTMKSSAFGTAPVIWVRYCMTNDEKTCSPGERKLDPVSTTRSWQMRIDSIDGLIQLNNGNAVTSLCNRGEEVDLKLAGEGLQTSSGRNLWEIEGSASYVATDNSEGSLEKATGWKLPTRKNLKSISADIRGNSTSSKVRGLTGTAKFVFTCGTP